MLLCFTDNVHHCTASTPITRAGYGQGSGRIWLDNVGCGGGENRLIACRRNALGVHNCVHSEDAGVICAPLFIPGPGMFALRSHVFVFLMLMSSTLQHVLAC